MSEPLFEIDTRGEVERQVDAMFAPLYTKIPKKYHAMIEPLERDMINALKAAMRQPAMEPLPPDPSRWPRSSGERLKIFLSPKQRREVLAAQRKMRAK